MANIWEMIGTCILGVSLLVGAGWKLYQWNKADRKDQFELQQENFKVLQAALTAAKDKEIEHAKKQALRDSKVQSDREEHNLRIVGLETESKNQKELLKEMKLDLHSVKESMDVIVRQFAVIKDREDRNGYTH